MPTRARGRSGSGIVSATGQASRKKALRFSPVFGFPVLTSGRPGCAKRLQFQKARYELVALPGLFISRSRLPQNLCRVIPAPRHLFIMWKFRVASRRNHCPRLKQGQLTRRRDAGGVCQAVRLHQKGPPPPPSVIAITVFPSRARNGPRRLLAITAHNPHYVKTSQLGDVNENNGLDRRSI